MTSVAASHISTRSKKHLSPTQPPQSGAPDVGKLIVTTAGLQLAPSTKSTSPRPEVPGETLAAMLGDRTRRSRCAPEFLQDLAARDSQEIFREWGKKVKIIIGPDAVAHYKKFLGGKTAAEILAMKDGVAEGEPLVVFAVTVVSDTGRRQVDYYTTWPQKESAHDSDEARRLKHLHSQFRKTARTLDREFKKAISAASIYGVTGPIIPEKYLELEDQKPAVEKTRPPSIVVPPPKLKVDDDAPPPASTTDSVISLPYLDFIRNVPNTHRIPLKVTNPDFRLSIISSISPVSPTTPTKSSQKPALASIAEAEPTHVSALTPFSTPAGPNRLLAPEGVARSDASIRSNRSSAASTTSTESRDKRHARDVQDFLIVLLDEKMDKDNRTWHGLERQVSRSTTRSSSRVSLWDGPLARETPGRNFVHPPRASRPDGEDSSDEDEDWDNTPLIPPPPTFFAMARSVSEPRPYHPVIPPTLPRFREPTSLGASPVGSFVNLNYGPSPLPAVLPVLYPHSNSPYASATYTSPYHSPAPMPPMRMSPYHSPAVPPMHMSPYHSPAVPTMQVFPYQSPPPIPMQALSRSGTVQPPFPE